MSPTRNGSSAIRRFEGSDAIEIRDGITFDFYTELPHMYADSVMNYVMDGTISLCVSSATHYLPMSAKINIWLDICQISNNWL